jgi:hypothetical protein
MKWDKFEIKYVKHKKGERLDVISARMGFFAGIKPAIIELSEPWTEMQLLIEGNRWMSTHPTENFWQIAPVNLAYGNVLVGGLGLDYAVHEMLLNPNVITITCVEIEPELIARLQHYFYALDNYRGHIKFVCSDIKKFIKHQRARYDFIYLDTWCGTGETEFYETVAPLRKLALPLVKEKKNLYCWAEEVMRGQFVVGITGHLAGVELHSTMSKEEYEKELTSPQMKKHNRIVYDFFKYHSLDDLRNNPELAKAFVWNWEMKNYAKC